MRIDTHRRLVTLALLFLPIVASAEMPDLPVLKSTRYAIRSATGFPGGEALYRAEGGSGLWSWNPETGAWKRLRPLVYSALGNGDRAGLTATEDRIVVQGTTFLEFDAATNRLLRRYPALDRDKAGWAFQGSFVTEALATTLGILPGYYGSVYCPADHGTAGPQCVPTDFPSRPAGTTAQTAWYHRGLATTDLTFMGSLPGLVTLDHARSRFWFRRTLATETTYSQLLGYVPIAGGSFGTPTPVETTATDRRDGARYFFYDRTADSLLTSWQPEGGPMFTTRRPANLAQPDTTIVTAANPPWGTPVAIATLAPEMPALYEQVVPIIGKGPGANQTYWQSDAWIFNPSEEPTTFTIRRVAAPTVKRELTLPPFGSMQLLDALGSLGGGPTADGGDGINNDALVVQSAYRWGKQLTIYSRTYTNDGNGTYGQAVPAVPSRQGYSTHTHAPVVAHDTSAEPPEFFLDLREPGQFRHNLGIVNDEAATLTIDLYYGYPVQANGQAPTSSINVPPHTVMNINIESLLTTEQLATRPSMVKIAGSRPAPIWLSMVDNKTGDGTFLPFATFGLLGALDSTLAIPQVAHTPGANGTFWRSDLYGYFPPPSSNYDQLPRAHFYPGDVTHCGGQTRIEAILSGPRGVPGVSDDFPMTSIHRRVFPDVVRQLSGCADGTMGALELNVGSWMTGFTRTYTTRADGGTYGDILPFYPARGWPVQHFTGITINDAYRINLGLYNGMGYAVTHRLVIYDAAGSEVRREEVTVDPRRSVQASLATFVGALPNGLHSMTVLPLDKEGAPGRSWAYVAIVDNATGDTTNLW